MGGGICQNCQFERKNKLFSEEQKLVSAEEEILIAGRHQLNSLAWT